MRVNSRWLNIPLDKIYYQLAKLGLFNWTDKLICGKHYIFGGNYAYPYSLPQSAISQLVTILNGFNPMFDWQAKVNELKQNPHYNNATQYGVEIISPNQSKWLASVYHLSPDENNHGHYVYIEAICKQNDRAPYIPIHWGWEGMSDQERNETSAIFCDKPNYEIRTHPIWGNQKIWLEISTGDTVRNIHTQIDPDNGGNTRFHHSYLVLFREIEPDTTPEPEPDPQPNFGLIGELQVTVNKRWILDQREDENGNVTFILNVRND